MSRFIIRKGQDSLSASTAAPKCASMGYLCFTHLSFHGKWTLDVDSIDDATLRGHCQEELSCAEHHQHWPVQQFISKRKLAFICSFDSSFETSCDHHVTSRPWKHICISITSRLICMGKLLHHQYKLVELHSLKRDEKNSCCEEMKMNAN